jgi:translation initiation factor IF-2
LAVRIYTLAKELKLDSKELVDICTNAGIPGKGSALASLTDEEAERVKQFLKGGTGKGGKPSSAAAPAMPKRPAEAQPRGGKMPVIVTAKPAPLRPKSAAPEADEPTAPADQPIAASGEAPTITPPAAPRAPGPLAGALRRDDYVGPGAKGKVPNVGGESKPSSRRKSDGASGTERARPAIKLAPMPTPMQPLGPPAASEPPAQKPDMKLPADVLGAGKMGWKSIGSSRSAAGRAKFAPSCPKKHRPDVANRAALKLRQAPKKKVRKAKKAGRCWVVANSASCNAAAMPPAGRMETINRAVNSRAA